MTVVYKFLIKEELLNLMNSEDLLFQWIIMSATVKHLAGLNVLSKIIDL